MMRACVWRTVGLLAASALLLSTNAVSFGQKDDKKKDKKEVPLAGLKALEHPDPAVRYRAVETLSRLGPQAKFAVPELRERLKDESGMVRVKAAEALWKIDRVPAASLLPTLRSALKDKSAQVRASAPAVIALFGAKAKNAVPQLVLAIDDKDLTVKLETVIALGELGPVALAAAPRLLDLSDEKEFDLLEPLVGSALGNMGDAVAPVLAEALRSNKLARKRVAAFALAELGPGAQEALPALKDAIRDSDATVRLQAARSLGRLGKVAASASPLLEKAVGDDRLAVRLQAVQSLWQIDGSKKHLDIVLAALKDDDVFFRETACRILGSMGPAAKESLPKLLELFGDTQGPIRQAAVDAVGRIGASNPEAAGKVKTLLADKEMPVRLHAAHALWKLTGQAKDGISVLEKGVYDQRPIYQKLALDIVRDMGPDARAVLPSLLELYREESDDAARQRIIDVIRAVEGKK